MSAAAAPALPRRGRRGEGRPLVCRAWGGSRLRACEARGGRLAVGAAAGLGTHAGHTAPGGSLWMAWSAGVGARWARRVFGVFLGVECKLCGRRPARATGMERPRRVGGGYEGEGRASARIRGAGGARGRVATRCPRLRSSISCGRWTGGGAWTVGWSQVESGSRVEWSRLSSCRSRARDTPEVVRRDVEVIYIA